MTAYYYDFSKRMVPTEEIDKYAQDNRLVVTELIDKLPWPCSQIGVMAAITIHHNDGVLICRHYPERGWLVDMRYYPDSDEAAQAIKKMIPYSIAKTETRA